jgi:hypothetical protein
MKYLILLSLIALYLSCPVTQPNRLNSTPRAAVCVIQTNENLNLGKLLFQKECSGFTAHGGFTGLIPNSFGSITIYKNGRYETCDDLGEIFTPPDRYNETFYFNVDANGIGNIDRNAVATYTFNGNSNIIGKACRLEAIIYNERWESTVMTGCGRIRYVSDSYAANFLATLPITTTINASVNTLTSTPITPNTPISPNTPVRPNAPLTPNTPISPNTPTRPNTPLIPNTPISPNTPLSTTFEQPTFLNYKNTNNTRTLPSDE